MLDWPAKIHSYSVQLSAEFFDEAKQNLQHILSRATASTKHCSSTHIFASNITSLEVTYA